MTLLTIVQDAAPLCGVKQPTAVASATDDTTVKLRTLAQMEGDELARDQYWRRLKVRTSITGDGSTTTFNLPSDFQAQMAGDAIWLQNTWRLIEGPLSDEAWIAMQSGNTRPSTPVWRYFGEQIETYPALSTGQVGIYEYRTNKWILDQDGTTKKARWTSDSDTTLIPYHIITLGIIWRYKLSIGTDYAESFATYQQEKFKAERDDAGYRKLSAKSTYGWNVWDRRKNAYVVIP